MACTLTDLDILIAKISLHIPSDARIGTSPGKRQNNENNNHVKPGAVSNNCVFDMFNTPGTSDYSPRGATASPPVNQSSINAASGQVSSSDMNQVPRHGSISSSAGRRSTDCENCIHLQNQMLRFKEQVVVIRGNLGNRWVIYLVINILFPLISFESH